MKMRNMAIARDMNLPGQSIVTQAVAYYARNFSYPSLTTKSKPIIADLSMVASCFKDSTYLCQCRVPIAVFA